ncbi:ribonuclease domain-containing protein [Arthrobacter sp. NPDC090010]|uniref:ribonuclease domain-containing protein n=1 Tax=Arthrobacter sp. NPDC090010 TaxID=3363942 RepID=UPI0038236A77
MNRKALLSLAGIIAAALVAGLIWIGTSGGHANHDAGGASATSGQKTSGTGGTSSGKTPKGSQGKAPTNPSSLASVKETQLPAEAQKTLELIAQGGPYPYSRDGINFGNFEGVLPKKGGGYYKEYTVPTPGSKDRGARRIIVGSGHEKYYTADHYATFRFILEGQ